MTVSEPVDPAKPRPLGRDLRLLGAASAISNIGDGVFLVAGAVGAATREARADGPES